MAPDLDLLAVCNNVFLANSDGGQAKVDSNWLYSALCGPLLLWVVPGVVVDPNRRDKEWRLLKQYSGSFSSASILDLAVDDLTNIGDATQALGAVIGGSVSHSGKGLHRTSAPPVSMPQFLFAANANGLVDVLSLDTGVPVVAPVRVPGVSVLCHYWRQ